MEAVAVVDDVGVIETDCLGLGDGEGSIEDDGLADGDIEAVAVVEDVDVTDGVVVDEGVADGFFDGAADAEVSAVREHNRFMMRFLHGYLRIRNCIR